MEVMRTGTPALNPALSPRRGRDMRRDEASSGHDFSTASGVVNLVGPEIPRPHYFIGLDESG